MRAFSALILAAFTLGGCRLPRVHEISAPKPIVDRAVALWSAQRDHDEDPPAIEDEKPEEAPKPKNAGGSNGARPSAPAPARNEVDQTEIKAALAARIDEMAICRLGGGPSGKVTAQVLFAPQGTAVVQLPAQYRDTESGACITRRLASAAKTFHGSPFVVEVSFAF